MFEFSLGFLGMLPLIFGCVVLGIASPCLKRVSREASSACVAQLCDLSSTARPHKSEALAIGDVDRSEVIYKRPRRGDSFRMSGNILESGNQGGHEAQNTPPALASEDISQGLSCSAPTNGGPHSSWTEYSNYGGPPDSFTHDPLSDDLWLDFDDWSKLEPWLNSPIVSGPDNHHSVERGVEADGKIAMAQHQVHDQLNLRDTDSKWHCGNQPLELSGISHGGQEGLNCSPYEIERSEPPELYNCFQTDFNGCGLGPSSYSNHPTLARKLQPQVNPDNEVHSYSSKVCFPQSSRRNYEVSCAHNMLFNLRNGPSIFAGTVPLLEVKCQELGLDYRKSPPTGSISISALERYIFPLTTIVNRLLGHSPKRFLCTQSFQGVSAIEVHQADLPLPLIRPLTMSEVPEEPISPSKLVILLESVLKWVLFNNEAFLKEVSLPEKDRPAFHQGILGWLEVEIFWPSSSLPIVGQVKSRAWNYDQSSFGLVQKKFFDFLFPKNAVKDACRFSVFLISLWYRNYYLKDWWESPYGGDECFGEFINKAIKVSLKRKTTVIHPSELTEIKPKQLLGNLEICHTHNSEEFSPSKFKKLYTYLIERSGSCLIEKIITEMIHSIQSKIKTGMIKKYFAGLSAALVEAKLIENDDYKLNVIRILDPVNRMITPAKTGLKISGILKRLSLYHMILFNYVESGRAKGSIGNSSELLEWLKKRFFSFDDGIPLFGVLNKDMVIEEKKLFGELQVFIVDYISRQSENNQGDIAAIAILGYWCKNEFPQFWKSNWDSDDLYWEFISGELIEYPVFKHN